MKNKENLISLISYLDFVKKELEGAIDGTQSLSQAARNLSLTSQNLNHLKNNPAYFDTILKKTISKNKDFEDILRDNQTMEEKLFKASFNLKPEIIVNLTDEESEKIRSLVENFKESRGKKIILLRFDQNSTLDETAKEFDVTKERIRQLESRALRKLKRNIYLLFKEKYIKNILTSKDIIKITQRTPTYYENLLRKILKTEKLINLEPFQEKIFENFLKEHNLLYLNTRELIDYFNKDQILFYELVKTVFQDTHLNEKQIIKNASKNLIPLEDANLNYRVYNVLRRNNIDTLNELAFYTERDLIKMKNFGKKSLTDLKIVLNNNNIKLKE